MSVDDFSQIFSDAGRQYGVDPQLLRAIAMQESSGNPDTPDSSKGAVGLMQIMPAVAKNMGVDPTDPRQAIPAAAKLLSGYKKQFPDQDSQLMAYYGGPNTGQWGTATKAYPAQVMKHYQGNQMAQNDTDDPLIRALSERVGAAAPPAAGNDAGDPLLDGLTQRATQNPTIPPTTKPEPQYTGIHGDIQSIGAALPSAKDSLSAIGSLWPESMSPTDIAMLAPATMAGGVAGEGVGAVGNALTRMSPEIAQTVARNKLLQLAGQGVVGAAQGATFNAATGENPLTGGETGAVVNMAIPAAGMVGKAISPEVAQLAKTAADKYGIEIPAGLLSNNPLVNRATSMLGRMGMMPQNENAGNFASAMSKTFGANTPKLTRDAMEDAGDNISNMFNEVKGSVPDIAVSNKVLTKLANIDSSASNTIADSDTRIAKQINNIIDIAAKNNGKIPNSAWQTLTDSNSDLATLAKESGAVGEKAREIKDALYDALGENAPPDMMDKFRTAQKYYKNWNTVKNGEGTLYNPVTGEVSPTGLAAKVRQTSKKYGDRGLEDLQSLGDIGQQFKLTPSSGTAENYLMANGARHLGQGILGSMGVAGYSAASAPGALGALAATYGAGKATGKVLASDFYRNALINKSLNASGGVLNGAVNTPAGNIINYLGAPAALTGNRLLESPQPPQ